MAAKGLQIGRTANVIYVKDSVASALIAHGVLSPEKGKIIKEAMARARQADQACDNAACERALEEVEHTIGP